MLQALGNATLAGFLFTVAIINLITVINFLTRRK